ncbi:LamG domain-containing protein, partial [Winogradskyella sp.]|uniref:LamG domain-containing protein n=1 Tax=Winogradskyella sp. TaxID=1883156 RepID=UPI0035167AFA
VISGNNHSVSVWFKLDNTSGYQNIFDFDYNNRIMFRVASSDANEANIGTSGWFAHNINFSANLWYHLVITFSNGNPFKIYVNGNIAYTGGNSSLNAQLGDNNFGAGNATGTHSINGKIDQLRIFNKELSATEVSTLYAETACVYTSTTDIVNYQGTNLAYYKFDNTAEDETGNYDGTESNITYEFGRFGQAAVFNGSSSYIQTTLSQSVAATSHSFWMNPTSSTDLKVPLYFNNRGGRIDVAVGGGGNDTPEASNNLLIINSSTGNNQWVHIAIVCTGWASSYTLGASGNPITAKVYINGVLEGTVSPSPYGQTTGMRIGRSGGTYYFEGKIDQVRIFDSELDATAIENLYNEKPEAPPNFNVALYTGIGNTQYISNVGFQPDLVWIKNRDNSFNHNLYFDLGGAINRLRSNTDGLADTSGNLSSFEANGFILTGSNSNTNNNGDDYVAWCWKGGGDAISNTVGDITSQVSANQDAGFSIVEYTGNLSAATTATGESVGHGLSSPPELIIFKNISSVTQWNIFSSELDNWSTRLQFDISQKNDLYSQYPIADPTSSVFYTNYLSSQNVSGSTHIAYCFHSVTGYQKIGSYTGTGGTSVNTISFGFAPAFVLIKRTNTTGGWRMFDSTRDTGTRPLRINHSLRANLDGQEYDGTNDPNGYMSFTNDGISFSTTEVNGDLNANGSTYIYLAIA